MILRCSPQNFVLVQKKAPSSCMHEPPTNKQIKILRYLDTN